MGSLRNRYLQASLAPSTNSVYRTGWNHYITFCSQMSLPVLPLEGRLKFFAAAMASRMSYKSIKVYLCGIQAGSRFNGWQERIIDMVRLGYALRGIRRVQGPDFSRPPRVLVTITNLRTVMTHIHDTYGAFDQVMLRAAFLLAFFGLLRVSEYTSPQGQQFRPAGPSVSGGRPLAATK